MNSTPAQAPDPTTTRLLADAGTAAGVGGGQIVIDDVGKVFYGRDAAHAVVALDRINLDIKQGEFVALVGPSGCGKSTLLMTIAGLVEPSTGLIRIDGLEVKEPRRSVGIMFQTPELFLWRTVLDNVMLPIDVFGYSRAKYLPRAADLIRMTGLEGFEGAYPHELSGGMRQRAALCRVLVADPASILMDEPFGALDELTRERLNLELLRIWDESRKTVVFVTHNIGEAVFLADRVVVMGTQPGRILADLSIDLPRPRDFSCLKSTTYQDHVFEIRETLGISK